MQVACLNCLKLKKEIHNHHHKLDSNNKTVKTGNCSNPRTPDENKQ